MCAFWWTGLQGELPASYAALLRELCPVWLFPRAFAFPLTAKMPSLWTLSLQPTEPEGKFIRILSRCRGMYRNSIYRIFFFSRNLKVKFERCRSPPRAIPLPAKRQIRKMTVGCWTVWSVFRQRSWRSGQAVLSARWQTKAHADTRCASVFPYAKWR